ncbi:MAG: heme exporter protein CcmD [Pseudomonadota bacterium]
MLEDLPRHAGYVIASYGITVVAIGALIGWIALARRRQIRLLEMLGHSVSDGRPAIPRGGHD